jgi:hypothetical protein
MGKSHLIVAAVFAVLLILHASPWVYFVDVQTLPAQLFGENGGHYLTLEAELWTCLLAGVALAFLGEGLCRGCCGRKKTVTI